MLERLLCNLLNVARLFLDQLHDGEGVPSPMADVGLGLDDKPAGGTKVPNARTVCAGN
jgi:hypothetical protein